MTRCACRARPVVNMEAEVKFLPEGQGKIDIGNKSCTLRYMYCITLVHFTCF
jgi:hypothetical protein